MNKFKILTILVLVLGSIVTAQEKQNDATWEETIDFLKKYSDEFIKVSNGREYSETWTEVKITWSYSNIQITTEDYATDSYDTNKWGDQIYKSQIKITNLTIPLKNLKNAGIWGYFIELNMIKNIDYDVKKKIEKGLYAGTKARPTTSFKNTSKSTRTIFLGIREDIELRPRLLKAFNHLAYLANEKRKKERKESGEKF